MKRIIIFFFGITAAFSAYSQTYIGVGDLCFDKGDYECAVTNYNNAFNNASGKDKQIAEIKLTRSKWCAEHIKTANQAFAAKNYSTAKDEYQKVLDSNPKDSYAQSQLEKCKTTLNPPATTLSVSKQALSFPASGGYETITVTTNSNSYSINLLPSWCSVQNYAGYFIITCKTNSGNISRNDYFNVVAGNKTLRINVSQSQSSTLNTILTISKENISFNADGGRAVIDLKTNAIDYQITDLPPWCKLVFKYTNWFSLECDANYGAVRKSWFTVTAGGKKVKIYVTQDAGKLISKQETWLNVSINNVSINMVTFDAKGGKSDKIYISSNAGTYSVTLVPSWCKVETNSGYIVVSCEKNTSKTSRQNYFIIKAGDKSKQIHVYQVAKKNICFNCPKTKDTWGLTLGYTQQPINNIDIIQFGLKANPLFKFGFGLNTGIIFSGYSNDFFTYGFEAYSVNIPLHLEYRMNFSKWFNIFAYGGIGIYATTNSYFSIYSLPTTFDFGGGFRISHVQFNVGRSLYLVDLKDIQNFSKSLNPYQEFIFSISYMF